MKTALVKAAALLFFINQAQADVVTGLDLVKTLKPYLASAESLIGVRSSNQMCHINVVQKSNTQIVSLIDQETGSAYASILIDANETGSLTVSGSTYIFGATYLLKNPSNGVVQYLELTTYKNDPSFHLYLGAQEGDQTKKHLCAYDF